MKRVHEAVKMLVFPNEGALIFPAFRFHKVLLSEIFFLFKRKRKVSKEENLSSGRNLIF